MRNLQQSSKGFTLIELLIVVVVVGIITAIAIPSYINSTRKAHRADAEQALTQLSQFMERNYTLAGRYDKDSTGANIALPYSNSPQQGTTFYTLAISTSPAVTQTAYVLVATPVGGQAKDTCGTLTLSNTGVKTPTTGCW